MNAGLPGAGIGGLFFVICALLAPLFEFVRVLRGRSSVERRRRVARQFFLAVGIIIVVERAFFLFALLDDSPGQGTSTAPLGGFHLALAPVLLSLGVLVLALGLASFLSLFKSQGTSGSTSTLIRAHPAETPADDGLGLGEDLAVDGRQQAEHSVGRGVLRTHVQDPKGTKTPIEALTSPRNPSV